MGEVRKGPRDRSSPRALAAGSLRGQIVFGAATQSERRLLLQRHLKTIVVHGNLLEVIDQQAGLEVDSGPGYPVPSKAAAQILAFPCPSHAQILPFLLLPKLYRH